MAQVATDLVVVIDTSGSMGTHAAQLSSAADRAIAAARGSCNADLRVDWFGIEGVWKGPPPKDPDSKFDQSYRDYLVGTESSRSPGATKATVDASRLAKLIGVDPNQVQGDQEDGAAAVVDLAEHYDWRPGAHRAILYLGDENLAKGDAATDAQDTTDEDMRDQAISKANERNVVVYTHCSSLSGDTVRDYTLLAERTKGTYFAGGVKGNASQLAANMESVFRTVICKTIAINKGGNGMSGKVDNLEVKPELQSASLSSGNDWTTFLVHVTNKHDPSEAAAPTFVDIEVGVALAKQVSTEDLAPWPQDKKKVKLKNHNPPKTILIDPVQLTPASRRIPSLAPGGTETLSFQIATFKAEEGNHTIDVFSTYQLKVNHDSENDKIEFYVES